MEIGVQSGFIDHLSQLATSVSDRVFAHFGSSTLTFRELHRQSDTLAVRLMASGLGPGDRVAVMTPNRIELIPLLFGLAKAGLVWVPVNAAQRGDGLRYILEHSDPKLIIVEKTLLETIRACGAILDHKRLLVLGGKSSEEALEQLLEGNLVFKQALPQPQAPFAIMYTSGTTGAPKGAILSHRMMRMAAEGVVLTCDLQAGDTMFVWEPLYHIGGAQTIILPLLQDVRLAITSRFSATSFWEEVEAAGATHIHYLGGILQILLKQEQSERDRKHNVRIAWGAACPSSAWEAIEARYSLAIRECYGMTEASSITTFNRSGVVGSVGRPVPWLDVTIRDPNGSILPAGRSGEIVVKSTSGALFEGYFNNPTATATALRHGALWTGDKGYFDRDGNLFFQGRMTDSIRCRGENVSAWEVEQVVSRHSAVEECAIIGVDADIGEQDIMLFVKPKQGMAVEHARLAEWLESRLAKFQIPRYIKIVHDFERTPSERVMKHKLSKTCDDAWDRLLQQRSAPNRPDATTSSNQQ